MSLITKDIFEPRSRYMGRKGIYPVIVNFDEVFSNLDTKAILANELDLTTEAGQALFNELVYSRYEGDVFTNVPRCPCGTTVGGEDEGERCTHCGYLCLAPTEQTIEPLVWIKAPTGVKKFMNVQVYQILKPKMTTNGFSVLDWLLDPKYRSPRLNTIQEEMLLDSGIKRGIASVSENFISVLETVFSLSRHQYQSDRRVNVRLIKDKLGKSLLDFLVANERAIFSEILPFPSKIGFIIEKVGNMTYIDPEMRPALNAMLSIAKADVECKNLAESESRTARAVRDLSRYYSSSERNKIFSKPGVARKLVYGTTPHFTFRTVITSEHLPHDHETIKIPWGAAVMVFKLHIANKLLKMGYTPNEWLTLIYDNVQRRNPTLDRIFDELIEESPGGRGPVCTFTRFPSLKHNSTTRYFINVKREPRHMSTSISLLSIKDKNADFDGDLTKQIYLGRNDIWITHWRNPMKTKPI